MRTLAEKNKYLKLIFSKGPINWDKVYQSLKYSGENYKNSLEVKYRLMRDPFLLADKKWVSTLEAGATKHSVCEAFKLPSDPKYKIEMDTPKRTWINIPDKNIMILIDYTRNFKKLSWNVDFKGEKGFEKTDKYDLSVIPTVFSVLKDFYDKAKEKPGSITFKPKFEDDKDFVTLNDEDALKVQSMIKDLMSAWSGISYLFDNQYNNIMQEVKTDFLTNHLKKLPGEYIVELDRIFNDLTPDEDNEEEVNYFQSVYFIFKQFLAKKLGQININNRRSDIYTRLIKRYWPDIKVKTDNNTLLLLLENSGEDIFYTDRTGSGGWVWNW